MLRPASLINDKPYRTLKARSRRYLKNTDEPKDKPSHDLPLKGEQILVENSPIMRQRFRLIASRIRVIKVHGIKKNSQPDNK